MLSSLSFGSHHKCSCSTPPAGGPADGADSSCPPPSHPFHFRFALGFLALRLASMLDSLVRVTRRVELCHFTTDLRGERNASLPTGRERPWFYPESTLPDPAKTYASPLATLTAATPLSPETSVDAQQRPIRPTDSLEENLRTPCLHLLTSPERSHVGTFHTA